MALTHQVLLFQPFPKKPWISSGKRQDLPNIALEGMKSSPAYYAGDQTSDPRWWYILPDWPNPHHDYTNELKEAKLKLLTIAEYEEHEDNDANGFTKVYEFSTYKGKSILSVRCF